MVFNLDFNFSFLITLFLFWFYNPSLIFLFSQCNGIICLFLGSDGKASVYNVGDLGSIPGLGRSAGEGNGNPLQYYCLENPMDSRTRLSNFTFIFYSIVKNTWLPYLLTFVSIVTNLKAAYCIRSCHCCI